MNTCELWLEIEVRTLYTNRMRVRMPICHKHTPCAYGRLQIRSYDYDLVIRRDAAPCKQFGDASNPSSINESKKTGCHGCLNCWHIRLYLYVSAVIGGGSKLACDSWGLQSRSEITTNKIAFYTLISCQVFFSRENNLYSFLMVKGIRSYHQYNVHSDTDTV